MNIARGDGSYGKQLNRLASYSMLVIDDWGLAKLADKERRDILKVLEVRHVISSTIISSQIPLDRWHDTIGDRPYLQHTFSRLLDMWHETGA